MRRVQRECVRGPPGWETRSSSIWSVNDNLRNSFSTLLATHYVDAGRIDVQYSHRLFIGARSANHYYIPFVEAK